MTTSEPTPILIVDDSELACEAVAHALEGAGYAVTALYSPFGLIRTIHQLSPRLMLLDVGLGSVNGTKLVSLAREHLPPHCPILLYSGRDTAQLYEDAKESGADGYISKSTTGYDLLVAVRHWIGTAKDRRI